jgi:predicted nucleotidyltransferase
MGRQTDIGIALVRTRRDLGMSQRELGERVGVTQPQIARWEANAYRTATLERVDAVAGALGIDGERELLAAESPAVYAPHAVSAKTLPVRDLGEVAARVRAHARELRGFGLCRVRVFGSFTTGAQTTASDVDVLVDFDKPVGFEFMHAADRLEDLLGREVDIVREEALKPRVRDRVLAEAIEVWHA